MKCSLSFHYKRRHEKSVGTPFPRVPAPLYPLVEMLFETTILRVILSWSITQKNYSEVWYCRLLEKQGCFKRPRIF